MEYPFVSLYIPVYNGSKYLKKTLPAIKDLNYPNFEILIIDDGSSDWKETKRLSKEYNVRFFRKEKNEGLAKARNTALNLIRADLIASLDADCFPDKNWLLELVKVYIERKNEKVIGVGGKLIEYYINSLPDLWRSIHMAQHWGDAPIENPLFLSGNNTLFEKKILEKVGGYPEGEIYRTNHEDFYISQKIKKAGYKLYYTPFAKVYHLRKDNIYTLFNTFWRYYFLAHPLPDSVFNCFNKFRRHWQFYALKFILEDIKNKRFKLLFLDLLFPFYESYFDWKYYFERRKKYENSPN